MMQFLSRLMGGRRTRRVTRAFRPAGMPAVTLERREVLAVALPNGFSESALAGGLGENGPRSATVAPDGRVFVSLGNGQIRLIGADGQLRSTPFKDIRDHAGELGGQGLMSVALHPKFAENGLMYAYYVVENNGVLRNRLSWMIADAEGVRPGTEKVIYESPPYKVTPGAPLHNGGSIELGKDGKIYIPTGELGVGKLAQSLSNPWGKILRLNANGTIPTDNPFYKTAKGNNRAIWALGLRNPFTMAVQPGTGLIYVNDVGAARYEEINRALRGANYGWPGTEGATKDPRYTSPLYAYSHSDPDVDPGSVAITGGVFYNPKRGSFPKEYVGKYFFADFHAGWIKTYDPKTREVKTFATGLPKGIVDLDVTPDGRLIYVSLLTGEVRQIQYATRRAPTLPTLLDRTAKQGDTVVFRTSPGGPGPFQYAWFVNGKRITGARGPALWVRATPGLDGATVRVVVRNAYGDTKSNIARLKVHNNEAPKAWFIKPETGDKFRIGQVMSFEGRGWDAEDGALPPSAFEWSIDLLHNDHAHPDTYVINGRRGGSFRLPKHAESGHIRFRIRLTVRDSLGQKTTVSRIIYPS